MQTIINLYGYRCLFNSIIVFRDKVICGFIMIDAIANKDLINKHIH